jgi:hypothetical protein
VYIVPRECGGPDELDNMQWVEIQQEPQPELQDTRIECDPYAPAGDLDVEEDAR